MKEYKLVEITHEEVEKQCRDRVERDGLYKAVEEELAEIVDIAHKYGYLDFNETMDRAQTILHLINQAERIEAK